MAEDRKLDGEVLPIELDYARGDDLEGERKWALTHALAHLRRPFAPEAIRFKVQNAWDSGALIVAYIDARLVIERLNAVVGAEWDDAYRDVAAGAAECTLTVFGVARPDVGTAGQFEPLKSARSDALKRAGVKFGIGVSVYAMAQARLDAGSGDNELRKKKQKTKQGEKMVPWIDDRTERWLRGVYAKWLKDGRGASFGPALEHGDEELAQGVDSDQTVADAAAEAAAAPGLEDERAEELKQNARDAWASLKAVAPRRVLPGAFTQKLQEASASHEALEALVDELLDMLAQAQPEPA